MRMCSSAPPARKRVSSRTGSSAMGNASTSMAGIVAPAPPRAPDPGRGAAYRRRQRAPPAIPGTAPGAGPSSTSVGRLREVPQTALVVLGVVLLDPALKSLHEDVVGLRAIDQMGVPEGLGLLVVERIFEAREQIRDLDVPV